ncbi:MAG: insulinase family protein [Deltaproteobacteria bacterium]|nr:insulinase family protein [Deltaproteobacteria bacterium]
MTLRRCGAVLLAFICLTLMNRFSLAQTFDEMEASVKEHVISNGMKFIVLERHEAPVVSFHVYADVGSANESYGITGISHLLEHMAFKGTTTVGTKDLNSELAVYEKLDPLYDRLNLEKKRANPDQELIAELEKEFEALRAKAKEYIVNNEFIDMFRQEGEAGINAYTSNDATQYINSLPSNKVEFWMAMTSDRFMNPIFREFYSEKNVVMEERRLSLETRPTGKLLEDFLATAFKAHPYHHSVVGHMSDIEGITRRDVEAYFKKFYSPSNLTVAIVGDVKAGRVFEMAETYFGRIPSEPKPEPIRTVEPEQWGERHVVVEAQSQPILIVGYHRPAGTHEDDTALMAIANIVGQGRTSRLHKTLVKETKIAVETGGLNGFPGDKFPNLIAFYAVSSPGHTSDECLNQMDTEIEKIRNEPITQDEMTKFKRTVKKDILDGMKPNAQMAEALTYNEVIEGDWAELFDAIDRVEALTAEKVKQVANKYFVKKNRTIGEIIPEK